MLSSLPTNKKDAPGATNTEGKVPQEKEIPSMAKEKPVKEVIHAKDTEITVLS